MFTRWPTFHRVLASLTDGTAIDGLLIDVRGPLMVLTDATVHTAGTEPLKVDGEIYIERSRVLYLQKPRGD